MKLPPKTMLYSPNPRFFWSRSCQREIASQRQAVVVEGYTDVMAMYAAESPPQSHPVARPLAGRTYSTAPVDAR